MEPNRVGRRKTKTNKAWRYNNYSPSTKNTEARRLQVLNQHWLYSNTLLQNQTNDNKTTTWPTRSAHVMSVRRCNYSELAQNIWASNALCTTLKVWRSSRATWACYLTVLQGILNGSLVTNLLLLFELLFLVFKPSFQRLYTIFILWPRLQQAFQQLDLNKQEDTN